MHVWGLSIVVALVLHLMYQWGHAYSRQSWLRTHKTRIGNLKRFIKATLSVEWLDYQAYWLIEKRIQSQRDRFWLQQKNDSSYIQWWKISCIRWLVYVENLWLKEG